MRLYFICFNILPLRHLAEIGINFTKIPNYSENQRISINLIFILWRSLFRGRLSGVVFINLLPQEGPIGLG